MPLIDPQAVVFDESIFPREAMDRDHCAFLADALRAGASLPPILIDKKTKTLIDGYHRLWAWNSVHSGEAIAVTEKVFKDKRAMLLESVRCNASHGRPLSWGDRQRCVQLARTLEVEDDHVILALNMTTETAERLAVKTKAQLDSCSVDGCFKFVWSKGLCKNHYYAKGEHRGKTASFNEHPTGHSDVFTEAAGDVSKQLFYVNQVIYLLTNDHIRWDEKNLAKSLANLYQLLVQALAARKTAS